MPQLRGHHLICLQFFHGEGYDREFTSNLAKIITLAEEQLISVSSGADDVCKKCMYLKQGRCTSSNLADDVIRKMDIKALALLGHSVGEKVDWEELKDSVRNIFADWYFLYCTECEWKKACESDDTFKQLVCQLS